MNKTQKSFVQGAAILGAIGLICKIIGAIYRIPMTGMIGTTGMAYYQTAYPVYTFLLAISSAGLPVAISKMVSERVTLQDYRAAHMVFQTAFKALVLIGLATAIIMASFSGMIAASLQRPDADITILAIAPALFFVSVMSAYRGYFQGLQMMTPTAMSQLIEQIGKLGLGLFFAYLWKDYGVQYGAAGAVLGVTLSEAIALMFMLILYNKRKKEIKENIKASVRSERRPDRKKIGRQLFLLALPIVIGACAMPLVQLADTAIVTNALIHIGYTTLQADSLFGNLTGVVNPLINMPAVLSLALAMSLVPAISASRAANDEAAAAQKTGIGFKLALLVGLPSAVGFYLLSTPIIHLLYSRLTPEELATAGSLLAIMAVGVLFLTLVQTMTGILQGFGKPLIPVINLFIGVAVKIAVSLILMNIPEINIQGAAIGTVACYAVAAILDVIFVIKYSKFKLHFMDNIIKPLLAAAGMGVFVYFMLPKGPADDYSRFITIATIGGAVVLYGILIFIFGALKREDMRFIPGGRRITKLMVKLKLWKGEA